MSSRGSLRAFWWSPLRSPRLVIGERHNLSAWASLGLRTRRPMLNFGDELSPIVLAHVTNRRIEWAPPASAEVVAIGSVLDLVASRGARGLAWGTGLRDPEKAQRVDPSVLRMVAVRGHDTRRALGLPADTPVGDPGLLAARFVPDALKKSARPALVPHFTQWNSREGRGVISRLAEEFDVLPPTMPPLDMIEAVARAPFVYSSSLHGVVVAHAVGTPAVLLRPGSGDSSEPDWKYGDYASALDIDLVARRLGDITNRQLRAEYAGGAEAIRNLAQTRSAELADRLADALIDSLDG